MNRHLQSILNFIQQDESLTAEEKGAISKSLKEADKEFEITAFKLERTEKVKRTTAILLEETIEELEQKRKAVEVQNHELEIETALERVRAIALSMKEPADMLEVCSIITIELDKLGVKEIRNVQTAIFYEDKGTYMNYEYYFKHNKTVITETSYTNHSIHQAFADQMLKGKGEFFSTHIKEAQLPAWIAYQKTTNVFIDTYLGKASSLNYYWYSLGAVALGISTYLPLNEKDIEVFKRFRNVFELAYRRFLDIEKAEAQAREARIEAALEKVRSRSLAVHKSDEFNEVIKVVFERLQELEMPMASVSINVFIEGSKDTEVYICGSGEDGLIVSHFRLVHFDHPIANDRYDAYEKGLEFFAKTYSAEEKNSFYEYEFAVSELKYIPDDIKKMVMESQRYNISLALTKNSMIVVNDFEGKSLSPKEIDIVKKFAKVFEQAYVRFLDLQKAETQAREAQIELALERVRARTMAMQKSEELAETSFVLFQQLKELGETSEQISIGIFNEDEHIMELYSTLYGSQWKEAARVDLDEPVVMKKIHAAWKKQTRLPDGQEKSMVIDLAGSDLQRYNSYRKKLSNLEYKEDRWVIRIAFFSKGVLTFSTTERHPHETTQLLERFAGVFDGTYTRFLDLQKAESQAREAQIEAALERIRNRTLLMKESNELAETAVILFQQFKALGLLPEGARTYFSVMDEGTMSAEVWMTQTDGTIRAGSHKMPVNTFPTLIKLYEAWKRRDPIIIRDESGEALTEYLGFLKKIPGLREDKSYQQLFSSAPKRRVTSEATYLQGTIGIITQTAVSKEALDILVRFAKVFEFTYTRFQDLQHAEARARESQIEASLERVRSKAMAMQKSEDLSNAVAIVFEELDKLDMGTLRCGISIINKEKRSTNVWSTTISEKGLAVQVTGDESMDIHPLLQGAFDAWLQQEDYSYLLQGEDLRGFYNALSSTNFKLPDLQADEIGPDGPKQYLYVAHFPAGGLYAFRETEFDEEAKNIVRRFGEVFNLTYTRFSDLKHAEEQAREAKIEAALERVRSRTLAMQKSGELAETAAVVFRQLINLGIKPNRLYIGIIKDDNDIEFWITDEDGTKVSTQFTGNINRSETMAAMYDAWKKQKKSITLEIKGKELARYLHYLLEELKLPLKIGFSQERRIHSIACFSRGFIGIASPGEQPQETTFLLERFAGVFNLTFTRFNDLKIAEVHAVQAELDLVQLHTEKKRVEDALTELRATQTQLIQSEKMASLGELTAGIAHEIQNPLNFVNNFSEVSNELIDEMKDEMAKGNNEDAIAIAESVKQNLEKINHHGKRADAIVKGMLQHSRTSSGLKEPTDINALANEYIRLCYHGLRAKDNSFNATIKTDFDNLIGKIDIIPQDVGRVILNLLTNAFYAVNIRKQALYGHERGVSYEPTVSVSTKRAGDKVELIVTDNGDGIPQKVLDKIFQPFFTTKPTGQGTGLGLSLSYDIITKGHGGELKVDTKEGEGSAFIIQLAGKDIL